MSNQYIRRKFCDRCGTKTAEVTAYGFDQETGERNTRDICTNPNCLDHCNYFDKHQFALMGFGATCKICGYQRGQYT